MTTFSTDEIAAIRKFFDWIKAGKWLDEREGLTAASADGIIVTRYEADYDGYVSTDNELIPWVALAKERAQLAALKAKYG